MNTTESSALVARNFAKVCDILHNHNYNPAKLIPILHEVQKEYRYLPEEVLTFVATSLKIPPASVYGVATFYSHYALEPKGKFVIKICDGTACHVKGSNPILDALREKLSLSEKKKTTDDMLWTVETVSCLGACGLAPVMLVNDDVYGQLTPEKALKIVDDITRKEME